MLPTPDAEQAANSEQTERSRFGSDRTSISSDDHDVVEEEGAKAIAIGSVVTRPERQLELGVPGDVRVTSHELPNGDRTRQHAAGVRGREGQQVPADMRGVVSTIPGATIRAGIDRVGHLALSNGLLKVQVERAGAQRSARAKQREDQLVGLSKDGRVRIARIVRLEKIHRGG